MTSKHIEPTQIAIHCAYTKLADITELIPHPRNPNKHGDKQIALLAKIIRHQGWRSPIVVSKRSGFVVAGHGRLQAAALLQVQLVPVDYQGFATEADEYAHLVADNRIAELAEINEKELAAILSELKAQDLDMDLTGFDASELGEALGALATESDVDAEPQTDKAEELREKWQTARGQIWQLGEHRLMCGDSTDGGDVDKLTEGKAVDICFTSPPYGAGNVAKLRDHYVAGAKQRKSFYKEHEDAPDEWFDLMKGWFSAVRPKCNLVICNVQMLADNKLDLVRWLNDYRDDLVDIVVWDKINAAPQMQSGVMSNAFEFCFMFGGNGSRAVPFSDWHGTVSNVVRIDPRGKNENADNHRAVMPVELPVWILTTLCPKVRTVIEPFCGTGTTIIACERLGRKCRAMEISPAYVAVAIQRWADATGKEPKKIYG